MEADLQVQEPAAADAGQQPPVAAEPAAPAPSGESGADQQPRNDVVNDAFRARAGQPTSKPPDAEPVVQSAPAGDEAAGGPERGADGRFLPRQAAPEKLPRRAAPEIARTREEIRQELLAEQQAEAVRKAAEAYDEDYLGNEDRYQSLLSKPDADLSAEDYAWREERKERRAQHPHVERHYKSRSDREIAAGWDRIKGDIRTKMERHSSKPGVDPEVFDALSDWGDLGEHLYHAGARAMAEDLQSKLDAANARIQELEQQYRFSGSGGLGSARGAVPAGRSPGAPPPSINDQFRRAAFGRAG